MKLTFKRNSWHRKLQKYVLNLGDRSWDDMPNLCPYFWLTIFCLLIVPFIFLFRIARTGFGGMVVGISWLIENLIFTPLDNFVFNPMYENRARELDGIDVYRAYRRGDRVFKKWLDLHPGEADALIAKYKAEWEKWKRDQQQRDHEKLVARKAARERRRKAAMRIAAIMQKTFPVLAVTVLCGLGFCSFLLLRALCRVWVWQVALKVFGIICLVVLGIVGIVIAIIILQDLIQKFKDRDTCSPVLRQEGPGPIKRFCRWFFGGIAESIAGVLDFFIQYIKASKENYCPAIEWEE